MTAPGPSSSVGPYRVPERQGTSSLWIDTTAATDHPPLQEDGHVDVAILGGGIAGLTAAYFLAKAGKQVAVLERYRVLECETGHTTAHITHVVDTRIPDLIRIHGEEGARQSWDSSRFALDLVERVAREENIACDFARVPGYLYGIHEGDERVLAEEATWAKRFGYEVESVDPAGFPLDCKAALRFPGQARFHPRKFLLGLADRIVALGGRIHEGTEVREIEGGERPARLTTKEGVRLTADHLLVCANTPVNDTVRMHTKLYPYRSYVITARVPAGTFEDALYWSTFERKELYGTYYYLRLHPDDGDGQLVILGGEDHKVGQEAHPEAAWERLKGYLEENVVADLAVEQRWSGQIIENLDAIPYIGVNPGSKDHILLATAFSGNGMTFGPLAGWMLAERVLGRTTPWDQLYDPSRKAANVSEWLRENKDMFLELAKRPFKGSEIPSVAALAPGEGAVLVHGGKKVAVYRDEAGTLQACSAICTHLGCVVDFNAAEKTFDCPCHGSRFAPGGRIVNGPALQPLERVDVGDLAEREAEETPSRRQGPR